MNNQHATEAIRRMHRRWQARMLGITLTAILATILLAASAHASRMPAPPSITIHENTPCPEYLPDEYSCTDQDTGEIWLLPDAGRFDRQHEIGHLFDAQILTDQDRAWFTRTLGFKTGTPWFGDYGAFVETASLAGTLPGEQFADAYAACALGKTPAGHRKRNGMIVSDWIDAYGYHPTVRQHRRICNVIAVLGLVASA